MKFTDNRELQNIGIAAGKLPNAVEVMQLLADQQRILIDSFDKQLSSIGMIGAKIDRLRKDLKHE